MIANDQGVRIPFEDAWLKAALLRAAGKAGYADWPPLDEFSQVVAGYLRADAGSNVIELPQLERVVRITLRDVGYGEIAARFRAVHPFQRISLAGCLRPSGRGAQRIFFRRLARRVESLHAARVQHLHFHDLEVCVRRLAEADAVVSWWSRPLLRARVVSFIRERISTLPWQWTMQCTIR